MLKMASEDLPVLGGDNYLMGESASEGRIKSGGSTRFPIRPSSSGSRPISSHSRRTPTPTKQIQLQAVKRKTEKIDVEEKIDWDDLNSALSQEAERKLTLNPHSEDEDDDDDEENDDDDERQEFSRHPVKHPPREYNWQNQLRKHDFQHGDHNESSKSNNKQTKRKEELPAKQKTETVAKTEVKEESSSSEDDSEEEEEGQKVPMQLTMEFLTCLMDKDYPNASKLCKMILIYDPANKQALEFQPLIEEKMQLEEDLKNQSDDDSESDSDDDDDDDDDDSDDSGDESDESDEDDDQEDENEENNNNPSPADSDEDKGDSGIASANSD